VAEAWYAPINSIRVGSEWYAQTVNGPEPGLTEDDLASYFKVSTRTIRSYREKLGLPSVLVRGVRRHLIWDVVRWVDGQAEVILYSS
jgi:hypothetical protein